MESSQLVLIVSLIYSGAVGFGDVFKCTIHEKVCGEMNDTTCYLTVKAGQNDMVSFFNSHQSPEKLEIGFSIGNHDEPYSTLPINGFVDSKKTSWEITNYKVITEIK